MRFISYEQIIRHYWSISLRVAFCVGFCGLAGWAIYTRYWQI